MKGHFIFLYLIYLLPIALLCAILSILSIFCSFVPLLVEYVAGGVLGVALAIATCLLFNYFSNGENISEYGITIEKNNFNRVKIWELQVWMVWPYFITSAAFITLMVFNILNNIEYVSSYKVGISNNTDIDIEWIKITIPAVILGACTGYFAIATIIKFFMSFVKMCPKCLSVDSYKILEKSDQQSRDYVETKDKDYYGTIGTIYDKDKNKVGTVSGKVGSVEYNRNVHEYSWDERVKCICCGREKKYRTGYTIKSKWE